MTEHIIALDIIRVFLEKKNYLQYRDLLNTDTLDRQTYDILLSLDAYFKRNPNCERIDVALFCTWFLHFWKQKLSTEEKSLFSIIFSNINARDASGIPVESLITEFNLRAVRKELISAAHEEKPIDDIEAILEKLKKGGVSEVDFLGDGISLLLPVADPTNGLQWRLPCLNKAIGPLSKSTFLVAAGRPDSGKTSLIISEATYMARQLKDDEVILWFVTENTTQETKKRAYCAMLQRPWDDFWQAINKGKFAAIDKAYKDKQGGVERIKFAQASGLSLGAIEREIAKHNTKLVVLDMIADLAVPKGRMVNEQAATANIKALCKWGLDLSCKYCPIIATHQLGVIVSENSENHKYPWMSALLDSKTDIQGKATVLLFIGRWEHDNRRYLSTPKNKRKAEMSDFRATVEFDQFRAIFKPT